MGDLAIVVSWSNRLELLLKLHYHAKGDDLQELIESCEERLPHDVIEKLHYIARVKNSMMQQKKSKLDDPRQLIMVCKQCENELQPRSAKLIWRFALFLIFAVTMGALWFYAVNWPLIMG